MALLLATICLPFVKNAALWNGTTGGAWTKKSDIIQVNTTSISDAVRAFIHHPHKNVCSSKIGLILMLILQGQGTVHVAKVHKVWTLIMFSKIHITFTWRPMLKTGLQLVYAWFDHVVMCCSCIMRKSFWTTVPWTSSSLHSDMIFAQHFLKSYKSGNAIVTL